MNEKMYDFYCSFCIPSDAWLNPNESMSRISRKQKQMSSEKFMKHELKNYKQVSLSNSKPMKEIGFMKSFACIRDMMPFVCGHQSQKMDIGVVKEMVSEIFDICLGLLKRGWWKFEAREFILQYLVVYYLYHKYPELDSAIRNALNKFDKFLLSFFYTLNVLKTHNKMMRNFYHFINESYTMAEFFLYLSLRNTVDDQEMVSASVVREVGRVFQEEDHQENLSISYSSIKGIKGEGDEKPVSLNHIFQEPLEGCLVIPKFKMFKIMRTCNLIDEASKYGGKTDWASFLIQYFECLEMGDQKIMFEHIVCAKVAEITYELSSKLLHNESFEVKDKFLQESFSYIFQILQLVFSQEIPQIEDLKSAQNVMGLRKHFCFMKALNDYSMLSVNKFAKKLLKNSFILELYKKYSRSRV